MRNPRAARRAASRMHKAGRRPVPAGDEARMREPGAARPGAAGRRPRDSHPLCSRANRPAQPRHSYEPRSGKSSWIGELAGKQGVADTIIGNCTTTIPMKCDLYGKDAGHTLAVGRTRNACPRCRMTCNASKPTLTVRLAWWCRPSGARRAHEFRDEDRREGGQASAAPARRRPWRAGPDASSPRWPSSR